MNENIKLIVCDVDGTILPAGKDRISRPLVEAFHKAIEKGITVFIDTGRHYTFLPKSFFENLPMERIGTINGACLVDREGNPIEKHPMSLETMNHFIEMSLENDIGLGFKFEDAVVTYANHEIFLQGYIGQSKERRKLVIDDTEKRTHHLTHGLPLGTFLICDEDKIKPYIDKFPDIVFAWSHKRGFDAFEKNITKKDAILPVLKEMNITWDNVIAFGDAENDITMIESAGIGVAMGNARDTVKEKADIVADTCENDGVAKTLKELNII